MKDFHLKYEDEAVFVVSIFFFQVEYLSILDIVEFKSDPLKLTKQVPDVPTDAKIELVNSNSTLRFIWRHPIDDGGEAITKSTVIFAGGVWKQHLEHCN